MTFLKASEASFLVADKFESLVNFWEDLSQVRGVGPITKRTAIFCVLFSQGTKEQGTSCIELGIEREIWY